LAGAAAKKPSSAYKHSAGDRHPHPEGWYPRVYEACINNSEGRSLQPGFVDCGSTCRLTGMTVEFEETAGKIDGGEDFSWTVTPALAGLPDVFLADFQNAILKKHDGEIPLARTERGILGWFAL